MSELLSPAGTIESFYAAIANGCDAIYLGLDKFSARAYANNFTIESLKDLIPFAHLRNVKIYVTINTIVYDNELSGVYQTLDKLAELNVDGIIVQDLAVAHYINSNYKTLKAHASTQMGVDDLDAATFLKNLGFKRIVFARETPIVAIKEIKENLKIEVEAFIHGALCVSYSGNCYMSSAIGERSGNRGRCAGCCRKFYSLINMENNEKINDGYLLSMKDLNVSNELADMSFVDSLKIEGRMKEPNYVASVTNIYRHILDKDNSKNSDLEKIFNRTYTNGFMNGATSLDITNIERPNNFGYLIGKVIKQNKQTIWIRLNKSLSKGDQIRIDSTKKTEEISVPVLKLFDNDFNEISTANKIAVIKCVPFVKIGANVYKTKDSNFIKEANHSLLKKEYKKLPISIELQAHINKPVFLKISYDKYKVFIKSNEIIDEAITQCTTKENIINQLSKLNDTPYYAKQIDIFLDNNCFIPLKTLNELRRAAIKELNDLRLENKPIRINGSAITPTKHDLHDPIISVEVNNDEQFDIVKKLGIKEIYYKNRIRRNNVDYRDVKGDVLVNGYGGIQHYLTKNKIITDSSLNVVNHVSAAILSSLGVDRITLSQEISKEKINNLVKNYFNSYKTYPNLELIVYGRSKIMHSKYCPMKRLGLCGECKKGQFTLRDEFAAFPILFNDDCTTTLLNSKPLNIMDELNDLYGINYYRLVFTIETADEVESITKTFIEKIKKHSNEKLFKKDEQTRGHFFTNPL